jgi:hypothetical protein
VNERPTPPRRRARSCSAPWIAHREHPSRAGTDPAHR